MDRVQVKKSEQITINKELVVEYDQPIKTKKGILKELRKALGDQCKIYNYKPKKIVYEYLPPLCIPWGSRSTVEISWC